MTGRRDHLRVKVSHPVLYFSEAYPRPQIASTNELSVAGTTIETLDILGGSALMA